MKFNGVLVGDFETSVYKGQKSTEVWASALVPVGSEDVKIFNSIESTFYYLKELKGNQKIYYHNLKFDGHFWLSYLIEIGYKQGLNPDKTFKKNKELKNGEFKYMISDMNQWYKIVIRTNNKYIVIVDSLKLIPLPVKDMHKAFNTKHKKTSIEYTGERHAFGCITEQEREYIKNDVLVVAEALKYVLDEGHDKLTIGSCCLYEFKSRFTRPEYEGLFPDLSKIKIDKELYGVDNADSYIRKSYRGGWVYVKEGIENKLIENGLTIDVNSLYPYQMHSMSGSEYPHGKPTFFKGGPDWDLLKNKYYFIRIKTKFELKEKHLPTIQIKNNCFYKSTQYLTTSKILHNGEYWDRYIDLDGSIKDSSVILTLTCTDYELIKKHYYLYDTEILDGCYFWKSTGFFDSYIDHYRKIKENSGGGRRTIAKLYSNNLYGKMSSGTNSSYKLVYLDENERICYETIYEDNRKAGYIAIGSAITSYARNYTISVAQANYDNFCYADTDSCHLKGSEEEIKEARLGDKKYGKWKIESRWDKAIFVRPKTYIEVEGNNYIVKCAGMPDKAKDLFIKSITQDYNINNYNEEEKSFLRQQRTIEDFRIGLRVPGKLCQRRIKGGVILNEEFFEMKK